MDARIVSGPSTRPGSSSEKGAWACSTKSVATSSSHREYLRSFHISSTHRRTVSASRDSMTRTSHRRGPHGPLATGPFRAGADSDVEAERSRGVRKLVAIAGRR